MSVFVHLSCYSDRSIGRGLIKPKELVEFYRAAGAQAACITDYGTMSAAVSLNNECKKHQMKPVFGMTVNVVPDKTLKRQGFESLVLLARNRVGFYNLIKIATIGSMYFYYVPRVDLAVLKEHSEGIIALTGDINGVAAHAFFISKYEGIDSVYEQYSEIYGDSLFFEIQPVPTEAYRAFNTALIEVASVTSGVKLIASGAPHYLTIDHREVHKQMLASKNFRNPGWEYPFRGDYHVRSYEEMLNAFRDLHGDQENCMQQIDSALAMPAQVLEMIETFSLREGVKVPSFRCA